MILLKIAQGIGIGGPLKRKGLTITLIQDNVGYDRKKYKKN